MYRNYYFLIKLQWSLTCGEYALLFSEFHDVKAEASISCKELEIIYDCQPEIIYDWRICHFTISLSYPRTHPLSSFSPFFYMPLAN